MDTLSLAKEARIYSGEETISLTSGAGKTGQPLVKNEIRTLSNIIHKNTLTKLEPIIQSEVSQKEKHQYGILTHIYGI